MPTRPDVKVILGDNRLGRIAPSADGTTLLVATGVAFGSVAIGDLLGPFKSVEQAEAAGLDAAYDAANTVLVNRHIRDFFEFSGKGVELYVVLQLTATTMAAQSDETTGIIAAKLAFLKGKIKQVVLTRIAAVGALLDQFESDLFAAVTNLQQLYDLEVATPRHRPVRFIVEGRHFQGTYGSMADLRSKDSEAVQIVILQDTVVAAGNALYNKYARAAAVAGMYAGRAVQRSIARVKDGPIALSNVGISSGTNITAVSEDNIETMNAKGYVFALQHSGRDGFFMNDDHVATALTSDYAYMTDARVIDKASRIIRQVYLDELMDDVEINPTTGKLDVSVIKQFQGTCKSALLKQMAGEISGANVSLDPDQNVQSTAKVVIEAGIIKRGTNRNIEVTLGFDLVEE